MGLIPSTGPRTPKHSAKVETQKRGEKTVNIRPKERSFSTGMSFPCKGKPNSDFPAKGFDLALANLRPFKNTPTQIKVDIPIKNQPSVIDLLAAQAFLVISLRNAGEQFDLGCFGGVVRLHAAGEARALD